MTEQQPPPEVKYDILSPAFFANPYPTTHRMRAEDPVYFHPLLNSWVLTRYDDILRVLKDNGSKFSAKRIEQYGVGAPDHVRAMLKEYQDFVGNWFAFLDPPEHTRLRALIARAFTHQEVERLRPCIESQSDNLICALRDRRDADLVADFAAPLPLLVFSSLMGIPESDVLLLRDYVTQVMRIFGAGLATDEDVKTSYYGMKNFCAYVLAHIEQRRKQPTDDLLTRLIEVRVDGSALSDEELQSVTITLLLGGHETTTNLLSNFVHVLLAHPDTLARVRNNPQLIEPAIEEVMRFESPTFANFRRTAVDLEDLGGKKIAAGSYIMSLLVAGNRDPERFPEPDRFNIDRADNRRHFSFSSGVHMCPGAALARMEARIALGKLLQAFPQLHRTTSELEWLPHMMVRGVKTLPIALTP